MMSGPVITMAKINEIHGFLVEKTFPTTGKPFLILNVLTDNL